MARSETHLQADSPRSGPRSAPESSPHLGSEVFTTGTRGVMQPGEHHRRSRSVSETARMKKEKRTAPRVRRGERSIGPARACRMSGGAKAHYDGIKASLPTDFTEDLKEISVPTFVMTWRISRELARSVLEPRDSARETCRQDHSCLLSRRPLRYPWRLPLRVRRSSLPERRNVPKLS
jgi:hypothetical protein